VLSKEKIEKLRLKKENLFAREERIKIFKYLYCCLRTKEPFIDTFEQAREILKEKTDIFNLISTLSDLEELKLVLFNKYQAMCFNFIRTPCLNSKESCEFDELFKSIKEDSITQKINIIGYFSNIIKKKKISKIDNKFFSFLEDDLKEIILELNGLNCC